MLPKSHEPYTPEEMKRFASNWQSDTSAEIADIKQKVRDLVDAVHELKSDRTEQREATKALARSVDALTQSSTELNTILSSGKGGLALLYLLAKIMGAVMVVAGGLGSLAWLIKVWPLKP